MTIDELATRMDKLATRMDELAAEMRSGFAEVNDRLDSQFARVNKKLDVMANMTVITAGANIATSRAVQELQEKETERSGFKSKHPGDILNSDRSLAPYTEEAKRQFMEDSGLTEWIFDAPTSQSNP